MKVETAYDCEKLYNEFKSYLKSYAEQVLENGNKRLIVNKGEDSFDLDFISASSGLSETDTLVATINQNGSNYSVNVNDINTIITNCVNTVGAEKLRTPDEALDFSQKKFESGSTAVRL